MLNDQMLLVRAFQVLFKIICFKKLHGHYLHFGMRKCQCLKSFSLFLLFIQIKHSILKIFFFKLSDSNEILSLIEVL